MKVKLWGTPIRLLPAPSSIIEKEHYDFEHLATVSNRAKGPVSAAVEGCPKALNNE
jgi:hypothetical protein